MEFNFFQRKEVFGSDFLVAVIKRRIFLLCIHFNNIHNSVSMWITCSIINFCLYLIIAISLRKIQKNISSDNYTENRVSNSDYFIDGEKIERTVTNC